jgi:hypothetical protein
MIVMCGVLFMLHGRLYRNVNEDMQYDLPDFNGDPSMVIPKPVVKVFISRNGVMTHGYSRRRVKRRLRASTNCLF